MWGNQEHRLVGTTCLLAEFGGFAGRARPACFFFKKNHSDPNQFFKKIVRPKPDSVVRGASTGEVKSPDLPRNSGVVRGLSNRSSSWETTHALTCSAFPKQAPSGKTAMPYNCWALGEWEPGTVIAA